MPTATDTPTMMTWQRSRVSLDTGVEIHYTDTAGRYAIVPAWKRPNRFDTRNRTNRVRNGVWLSDSITGLSRHFDSLGEAQRYAERRLQDEAQVNWSQARYWQATLTKPSPIGLAEVSVFDGRDQRLLRIGVGFPYGRSDEQSAETARKNVERWLKAMGVPALPRKVAER